MQEITAHSLVPLLALFLQSSFGIELTFELPDNAKECFFEEIQRGNSSEIEFQVINGGQYDVDAELVSPTEQILFKEIKKQNDSYSFVAEVSGTYRLCFSNEFSTFSHKSVYFDWQVGDDDSLYLGMEKAIAPLTLMESAIKTIHEKVRAVDYLQTHHRLRESTGRKAAEELNERVLWWSFGQTFVLLIIGVGQVLILRSFFAEKRTGSRY